MLAENDAQVRQFNTQMAAFNSNLASQRENLQGALHELSFALADVARLVRDNQDLIRDNADRLATLADHSRSAGRHRRDPQTAPLTLSNVINAYDPDSGSLHNRLNIREFQDPSARSATSCGSADTTRASRRTWISRTCSVTTSTHVWMSHLNSTRTCVPRTRTCRWAPWVRSSSEDADSGAGCTRRGWQTPPGPRGVGTDDRIGRTPGAGPPWNERSSFAYLRSSRWQAWS